MAILGFILPPESGEKVSMEITVLLSVAVFMLMVSETMPPTSETFPYIGEYKSLNVYFPCLWIFQNAVRNNASLIENGYCIMKKQMS